MYAIAALAFGGRPLTKCWMSPNWLPRLLRAELSIRITSSSLASGPRSGAQLVTMAGFPFTLMLTSFWETLAGSSPCCLERTVTTARPCPVLCENAGAASSSAPADNPDRHSPVLHANSPFEVQSPPSPTVYSETRVAVPRKQCRQVAFSLRKSHLKHSQKGHFYSGFAQIRHASTKLDQA